jgi:outer membrane biosynthesis protein TonB
MLAKKGAPIEGVITKIKFDANEATPKLIFSPVNYQSEAGYKETLEMAKTIIVSQIIGAAPTGFANADAAKADNGFSEPAPQEPEAPAAPPVTETKEAKPKKETKPKKEAVETPAEKPAEKATPAVAANISELEARLRASMTSGDDD